MATDNKLGLGKKLQQLRTTMFVLPRILATEGVNFSKESWRRQGWQDTSFSKWKKRKPGQKRNEGRAILVDSGDLRKSVRIIGTSPGKARYGSDLVYAPVHNFGLRAGRGKGFKMPKRQFVGQSKALQLKMNRIIDVVYMKILK